MDEEAREQIRVGVVCATDTNMTVDEAVEYIVRELEDLGYCKLPEGKPPLLSEEEIRKQERKRMLKIFASFGKIQLSKPLSGKEFEALFD